MKKIRINELARELEVKPGVILDMLPVLGVHEKKTHSSSVDEDVALELRHRLTGSETSQHESANGNAEPDHADNHEEEGHAPPPGYGDACCKQDTSRCSRAGNGRSAAGQRALQACSADGRWFAGAATGSRHSRITRAACGSKRPGAGSRPF